MTTYSVLLGSNYPFQLNSSNMVEKRLYGSDLGYLPSGADYWARDQKQLGKTQDSLDLLSKKQAPIGDLKTEQPTWYHDTDFIQDSSKTYNSGLRTGLQLPGWQNTSLAEGGYLNPYQQRDNQQNANSYLMKHFYSRSVPQRTSDSDRGL